jgi:hypothetical protein
MLREGWLKDQLERAAQDLRISSLASKMYKVLENIWDESFYDMHILYGDATKDQNWLCKICHGIGATKEEIQHQKFSTGKDCYVESIREIVVDRGE